MSRTDTLNAPSQWQSSISFKQIYGALLICLLILSSPSFLGNIGFSLVSLLALLIGLLFARRGDMPLILIAIFVLQLLYAMSAIVSLSDTPYLQQLAIAQSLPKLLALLAFPVGSLLAPVFIQAVSKRPWSILGSVFFLVVIADYIRTQENLILNFRLYGTLTPVIIFQFFIALVIFFGRLNLFQISGLVIFGFIAFSASSNTLFHLTILMGLFLVWPRITLLIGIGLYSLLLIYLAIFDVSDLQWIRNYDPNMFTRVAMWHSVIERIIEHPFGEGYGTAYFNPSGDIWAFIAHVYSNQNSVFVISNHSSLIDTTLKTGIFSTVLLVILMWQTANPNAVHSLIAKRFAIVMTLALLILIMANPILESGRSSIAFGLILGFVWGLRYSFKFADPKRSTRASL